MEILFNIVISLSLSFFLVQQITMLSVFLVLKTNMSEWPEGFPMDKALK